MKDFDTLAYEISAKKENPRVEWIADSQAEDTNYHARGVNKKGESSRLVGKIYIHIYMSVYIYMSLKRILSYTIQVQVENAP